MESCKNKEKNIVLFEFPKFYKKLSNNYNKSLEIYLQNKRN